MFAYDHQFRSDLHRDRVTLLRLAWPAASSPGKVRLALSRWLIRTGDRLAPDPCPSQRELSFRA